MTRCDGMNTDELDLLHTNHSTCTSFFHHIPFMVPHNFYGLIIVSVLRFFGEIIIPSPYGR